MICRMNLAQRLVLLRVIRAEVKLTDRPNDPRAQQECEEAVEAFHAAFKNESEKEDNHNHVSRT